MANKNVETRPPNHETPGPVVAAAAMPAASAPKSATETAAAPAHDTGPEDPKIVLNRYVIRTEKIKTLNLQKADIQAQIDGEFKELMKDKAEVDKWQANMLRSLNLDEASPQTRGRRTAAGMKRKSPTKMPHCDKCGIDGHDARAHRTHPAKFTAKELQERVTQGKEKTA